MRALRVPLCSVVLGLAAGVAAASTVIGLSVEDQARLCKMVVMGEVVGMTGEDDPVNGIETAVTLRVTDVLEGDVRPGQTVVFHTRGGEVDGTVSQAVGEAVFRPGMRTLVFIEDIDGRLYNLGLSSGVWNVVETPGGRPAFTRALQDGLEIFGGTELEMGPITLGEMASRVAFAVRNADFDHPMLREARIGRR